MVARVYGLPHEDRHLNSTFQRPVQAAGDIITWGCPIPGGMKGNRYTHPASLHLDRGLDARSTPETQR